MATFKTLDDPEYRAELEAQAEVGQALKERYGLSEDSITNRYDSVAQSMGLSGNHTQDLQSIKDSNTEIEERAFKVRKLDNESTATGLGKMAIKGGINDFLLGGLEGSLRMGAEGESVKEDRRQAEASSLANFSDWVNQKVQTSSAPLKVKEAVMGLAGRSANFWNQMGGYRDDTGEEVLKWEAEAINESKQKLEAAFEVNPELESSTVGQVFRGFGQAGVGIPYYLSGAGLVMTAGQLFTEGRDDYVANQESKGLPVDEDEAFKVGMLNVPAAIPEYMMDRFVVGKIFGDMKGVKAKDVLKTFTSSAAFGGMTEGAQNTWQNAIAKYISGYDPERELDDGLVQSILVGAIVDSSISTGAKGTQAVYSKFLDTEKAATSVDFKATKDLRAEEIHSEVLRNTGDPIKAELAAMAHSGDEDARKEYVESDYYQGEEIAVTAGATTEEVAAGIASDLEPMTREQQVEYDKTVRTASLGVVAELFEDRADMTLDIDEGRVVSALDAINAEADRQGMTDLQRDAYAMDVVTAAAANNNTTYEAMASQLDKLPVRGSATVEFVQDVANYRLKLNQGADVDTLYEEATHIEFKRFRAADPQAMEKARSWKQMVEQETGKVTHGDTDTDVDEWVARKGVAWAISNHQNQEQMGKLDESIRAWLERFIAKLKAVFADGKLLRKLDAEGKLDAEFKAFLNRATGIEQGAVDGQGEGTGSNAVNAGIKSAYNRGTFDPQDPRISFQIAPEESAEYMQLAQDPEANEQGLQDIVNEASTRMANSFPDSLNTNDVPNTNSISSTLSNYESFGVKDLPLSLFGGLGKRSFYSKSDKDRVDSLMLDIQQNGVESPLIVVIDGDKDGAVYVLEGGHRLAAIEELKLDSLPALVLVDLDADPVTYDDDGNIIPIEERFKLDDPRINFQIAPEEELELPEREPTAEEREVAVKQRELLAAKEDLKFVQQQRKEQADLPETERLTDADFKEQESKAKARVSELRDAVMKQQVRAVESRKRQALQESYAEKLAAEVVRRVDAIRKHHKQNEDLEESMKLLEELVQALPVEVRGKFKGFGKMSGLKTKEAQDKFLERSAMRVENIFNQYMLTKNRNKLKKILKKFTTKNSKKRRELSKRYSKEVRDALTLASQVATYKKDVVKPKDMSQEVYDNVLATFSGVLFARDKGAADKVAGALIEAKTMFDEGRLGMADFYEARSEAVRALNEQAIEIVADGEKVMTETQLEVKNLKKNRFERAMDSMGAFLFHALNGMQQHMNILDGVKGGFFEQKFLRPSVEAAQQEATLQREHLERTWDDILEVIGGDHKAAASWFKHAEEDFIDTGIKFDLGNGVEEQQLNVMMGVEYLMQWGDPSLRPTFENMGIDEGVMQQIRDFIGPNGVALAEYLRSRYAEIGLDIQATHKDVEGFAMDLVDGYGGRVRRAGVKVDPDDPMFSFDENSGRASVKSASMKERTGNTNPIKAGNAINDFLRHMQESNHYLSHAQLAKDLNSTFGGMTDESKVLLRAIKQKFGENLLNDINLNIENIVTGQFKQVEKLDRIFNDIRGKFTKASLMIKPSVLIKQLSSQLAFIEEIGFKAYGEYWLKYLSNPAEHTKRLLQTEYVKNRMDGSQFADIQQQINMRRDIMKKMRISDMLMMNVRIGDVSAVIMGGAPVYLHAYDQAIASGQTELQARAEAELAFATSSDRAQQASAEYSKGRYLSTNGIMRTFFMYLTSPLQYQRNINVASYNAIKAFMNKAKNPEKAKEAGKQAMRALIVFHVILPQIFQALASGLTAIGSDDEDILERFWARQQRALVLGNANTFPILGQFASALINVVVGLEDEIFDSTGSPLIDFSSEVLTDFTRVVKSDREGEDVVKLLEDVAQVSGIPLETTIDYAEAFKEVAEGDTDFPVQRLLGWSKWALGED